MCGNVTLLGRLADAERRAVPEATWSLIERMLRISQMRGAQSGGGAIQVRRGEQVRQVIEKCLNSKRGDLPGRMRKTLSRAVRSSRPHAATVLVQGHVRYATASPSSRHEAHPFRYAEARERGPRRVARFEDGKLVTRQTSVETALTHNGDMDGMRWRGKALGFSELGCLLERILGVRNPWIGDSPVLAAAIELYVTKGMWFESFRLAYQLTVAPPAPDPASLPSGLDAAGRLRAVRELMQAHPAPTRGELLAWETLAEKTLSELLAETPVPPPGDAAAWRRLREALAVALRLRFESEAGAPIPAERCLAFARAAVNAFFDNDLYIALRKLEAALDGTFGCVVTSTLEPGCFVAMSRGQPLSLGFERKLGRAAVVSERTALKVMSDDGTPAFDERLDLDLCRGEIVRVELPADGDAIRLTLYGISNGRESTPTELVALGRMVNITQNDYVAALPKVAEDRVAADFASLAPLLQRIRASWQDRASTNRRAAEAFADRLLQRRRARVILLGVTNDLWVSQQFVQNLSSLFPEIEARAVSSNEVLANPSAVRIDADTLVLAVSQSGQDFPTLGAFVLLSERAPAEARDGFFVLTGEVDSLLGQAVGQSYARGAPFTNRIFSNLSGFRPSEAAIATVSATHLTLVELLLFLAGRAFDTTRHLKAPLGLTLARRELDVLCRRRDAAVDVQVAGIVSRGPAARLGAELGRQARRWSRHVSEGLVAFALVVLVLELNLQLGLGLLPSSLLGFLPSHWLSSASWVPPVLSALGAQANVLFYAFLGPLLIWALRRVQGRPGLHRHGTRELLIGDVGYVHQVGWLLAKKLFSLSYGFASIKPYSANCQDELIMTHEPLRGTLLLLGIPDGRKKQLSTRAGAALMAARQFSNSRSLGGGGAEIVTIGHAPSVRSVGTHVELPSVELPEVGSLAEELVEGLFDSWERLVAIQCFLDELGRRVSRLGPFRYDRSRTKDQVFAPTTAAPVSAAAIYQLLSRTSERYESSEDISLPFEVKSSEWRGSAPPLRTTVWKPEAILRELERAGADVPHTTQSSFNDKSQP
jgi:hypothetical protein